MAVAEQQNGRIELSLVSVESGSQTGKSCVHRMHSAATYLATMQPGVHTYSEFSMPYYMYSLIPRPSYIGTHNGVL